MPAPAKAYTQAERLPRELAAFAKAQGDDISPITRAHAPAPAPPDLWWRCIYRVGGVEAAVEQAHRAGLRDAWAEREGFTWLYLRMVNEADAK